MVPGIFGSEGWSNVSASQQLPDEQVKMIASVHPRESRSWQQPDGTTVTEYWDENMHYYVRKVTTPEMQACSRGMEGEALNSTTHRTWWRFATRMSFDWSDSKCTSCGGEGFHNITDKGKRLVSRCSKRQKRLEDNMRKLFWERGVTPKV